LVYTTPSTPSQLPILIHSSLGIHSLLKKQPLKANVIDRDKITVPPNWDSWGKIRLLREGFDAELVSNGWSIDLGQPLSTPHLNGTENGEAPNGDAQPKAQPSDPEGSAVTLYEQAVQDPSMDALQIAGRSNNSTELEVETSDPQTFLGQQLKLLEGYRQQSEKEAQENPRAKVFKKMASEDSESPTEAKVTDHIGPVQFNMGGIQVDADDMVQRLKVSFDILGEDVMNLEKDANFMIVGSANVWLLARAGTRIDRGSAAEYGESAGVLHGVDEPETAEIIEPQRSVVLGLTPFPGLSHCLLCTG
jgi:dynein light intermediate chain 1, cytosolic